MFYDELGPNNESPTPGTPRALVLEEEEEEEEEERGTHDLRNLLDKKKVKEGDHLLRILGVRGSTGTRRKVNISFMKVHGTQMRCARKSQTARLHDGSSRNLEGPIQGSANLA